MNITIIFLWLMILFFIAAASDCGVSTFIIIPLIILWVVFSFVILEYVRRKEENKKQKILSQRRNHIDNLIK